MNVNLFIVLLMNVLKNIGKDIYVSFRDTIINVVEDFIIEKKKIEEKEKESFSYEQKFGDLKNMLYDRSFKESRRLDKNIIIHLTFFSLIIKNAQKKYYSDLKKDRKYYSMY